MCHVRVGVLPEKIVTKGVLSVRKMISRCFLKEDAWVAMKRVFSVKACFQEEGVHEGVAHYNEEDVLASH